MSICSALSLLPIDGTVTQLALSFSSFTELENLSILEKTVGNSLRSFSFLEKFNMSH